MGSGRNIEEASRRSSRRLHTSRTLPSLSTHPGLQSISGLRGALEFLEWPASEWTPKDLQDWFVDHLVTPGLMKRPQIVREPGATPVMLDPRADGSSSLEELIHRPAGASSRPSGG